MEGHHVVRRSDRFWAGLSPDLIIEQVLMRSIKTHDGLTRGKGMTENQRLVWVLSMAVCASINETMQKFSDVSYKTSDKHKDVTSLFQYELCTYPAALCESSSLPTQPNKAVLADYLWKSMKEEQRNPSGDVQYVLDGGPLLHRVSWPEAPPMGV